MAMSGAGDMRYVELQVEGIMADAGREHHHFPGARRLLLGWQHATDGSWASTGVDPKRWEVHCAECGDTDGPAEQQSAAVQQLRGPYRNEHHARRAADEHFNAH
jgi:hypothetical protein